MPVWASVITVQHAANRRAFSVKYYVKDNNTKVEICVVFTVHNIVNRILAGLTFHSKSYPYKS